VYGERIALSIGLETELVHADSLAELEATWARHADVLDYAVGSVHHVGGTPIDFDAALYARAEVEQGGAQALFAAYYDAQLELLLRLRPAVVGHFDLVRLFGGATVAYDADVWARVQRNVAAIVAYGGLVEVNARAFKKGLPGAYPQRDVLAHMCARGDVRFTLSDDSHGPRDVGLHYPQLRAYLREHGVRDLYAVVPHAAAVGALPAGAEVVPSTATLGHTACIVRLPDAVAWAQGWGDA
jgi:histidinol-phosphatase (PHP family)